MKERGVNIREVNNGFQVKFVDDTKGGDYVFKATEFFVMLEEIGKFIYGNKITVKER